MDISTELFRSFYNSESRAIDRQRRLISKANSRITLLSRGNDALAVRSEVPPYEGELTELSDAIHDAKNRMWLRLLSGKTESEDYFEVILRTAVAKFGDTFVWVATGVKLATIESGLVMVPGVRDCLGIIARSNLGLVSAAHVPRYDGHSLEDVQRVLIPHNDRAHGASADEVEVGIVGLEYLCNDWQFNQAMLGLGLPIFPMQALPLRKDTMSRALAKFLPEKRINISQMRLNFGEGQDFPLHTLYASTAEPGIFVDES